MDVLLASGNQHKLREMSAILPSHTLLTPASLGLDGFSPTENAPDFQGNALIKARALYQAACRALGHDSGSGTTTGVSPVPPILADDSGICVRALDGAPGIYSARYGHERPHPPRNDHERNQLLLKELSHITNPAGRGAYYVCAMVLLWTPERYCIAQETWEGSIAFEPSAGTQGFGYDPVFVLPELGITVAELPAEQKNRLSHRAKASARVALHL